MSKLIRSNIAEAVIIGNPAPPRSGAFEVSIDGKLVFSRFKTNTFPTHEEVLSWL